MNKLPKKEVLKESNTENYFILHLIFGHYLSPYQNRPQVSTATHCYFYSSGFIDTLVLCRKTRKSLLNIPDHLSGMQRGCADHTASEPDVPEPVPIIWLTSIYAELHIAKLI